MTFRHIRSSHKDVTLIEILVVILVIVITLAFKFFHISYDARESELTRVHESMLAAIELVHDKSVMEANQHAESASITLRGEEIKLVYGYPAAIHNVWKVLLSYDTDEHYMKQREFLIDNSLDENFNFFVVVYHYSNTVNLPFFQPAFTEKTIPTKGTNCLIYYHNAKKNKRPTTGIVGCKIP